MFRVKIASCASAYPERVLSNADLEGIVDTTDAWIVERTGIRNRRIAAEGECVSDLAAEASIKALEQAGIVAQDLDLIIFATTTPDYLMPATACVLQEKLGCPGVPGFDLIAACSGWVYGVSIAQQFIASGTYEHVLVVGAETLSRIVNWEDRATCILFGDGAGVSVVSRSEDGEPSEILVTRLYADGGHSGLLTLPSGGSARPINPERLERGDHLIHMNGRELFKVAVRSMATAAQEALAEAGASLEEVRLFVPHQANQRIIDAVAKQLRFPTDRIASTLAEYGNVSSATVPAALAQAAAEGQIERGDLILVSVFGAGLTYGSTLFRW